MHDPMTAEWVLAQIEAAPLNSYIATMGPNALYNNKITAYERIDNLKAVHHERLSGCQELEARYVESSNEYAKYTSEVDNLKRQLTEKERIATTVGTTTDQLAAELARKVRSNIS